MNFTTSVHERVGSRKVTLVLKNLHLPKLQNFWHAFVETKSFENWEVEKKYKKNLEALKHEIEERNIEIKSANQKEQAANARV